MEQVGLFPERYDSYLEALRDDVNTVGGPSEVGEWFWKEKSHEGRRNAVNACLNSERRERFSDDQVDLIMRRAVQKRGYSAAHYHRCDIIGTERPLPLDPNEQKDKAVEAVRAAAEALERATTALARVQTPPAGGSQFAVIK